MFSEQSTQSTDRQAWAGCFGTWRTEVSTNLRIKVRVDRHHERKAKKGPELSMDSEGTHQVLGSIK